MLDKESKKQWMKWTNPAMSLTGLLQARTIEKEGKLRNCCKQAKS